MVEILVIKKRVPRFNKQEDIDPTNLENAMRDNDTQVEISNKNFSAIQTYIAELEERIEALGG